MEFTKVDVLERHSTSALVNSNQSTERVGNLSYGGASWEDFRNDVC